MAVFSKQSLITELSDRVDVIKAGTQTFFRLNNSQLNCKLQPDKWSIAEIFQHLNIIHAIYIRSILPRMTSAPDVKATPESDVYRSGWLGDWLYNTIMPRQDGTVIKMKTLRSLHPTGKELDGKEVLHQFLQQCDALDDILHHASTKNLQKIKIPISFANFLHLRLGDNLRYLVAHSERHMLQAQKVMDVINQRDKLIV